MAAADQLTGLMSLIKGVQGSEQKSKTSGGSRTTQTQLSDTAVNEQIQRILAGPGGVQQIGGSARRSGLYDSTSQDLLMGNLTAKAAAAGEIARAPTVETSAPTTTVTETPGVGLGATVGTIAGAALLNQLFETGGGMIGDVFSGIFGGGDSGSKKSTVSTKSDSGGWSGSGEGYGISADSIGGYGADSPTNDVSLGGSKGFKLGMDLDTGDLGGAASGFGALGGGILNSVVGSLFAGGQSGGASTGGGGSSGGSVICTALMEKGELDAELYAAGSKYLAEVSPVTLLGYHFWACSVAGKIRKGNAFLLKLCRPFARGRTALLASNGSFLAHCKHPVGSLTKFVGEPICWAIGAAVVVSYTHSIYQYKGV